MLVSRTALLLALSATIASAFPLASTPDQIQFSRFKLKPKSGKALTAGCYYTCPPLTDEVPADFGVDAEDTQGVAAEGNTTICRYESFFEANSISCAYENETGRLLSSSLLPANARTAEAYAGCAPLARARNDQGKGTCVRSAAGKRADAKADAGRQRVRAAQWTREKLQKREVVKAERAK